MSLPGRPGDSSHLKLETSLHVWHPTNLHACCSSPPVRPWATLLRHSTFRFLASRWRQVHRTDRRLATEGAIVAQRAWTRRRYWQASQMPARTASARATRKPNIVVIMGDDVGVWNIGAYHRGMMAGRDAEPRPARLAGNAVYRLLRRGELHGRACQFHHRPASRSAPA